MPKTLNNRLDKLENEIQLMLMCRESTNGTLQHVLESTSVSASVDGTVEEVKFTARSRSIQSASCMPPLPTSCYHNSRPASPDMRCLCGPSARERPRRLPSQKRSSCSCAPNKSNINPKISSYLDTIKNKLDKGQKAIENSTRSCKKHDTDKSEPICEITVNDMPYNCRSRSSPPTVKGECTTCTPRIEVDILTRNATKKELEKEVNQRQRAESCIQELKHEIETLKKEINSINQEKIRALQMTNELQEKYEDTRNSRKELDDQLQNLQHANQNLCRCLEEETKLRQTSLEEVEKRSFKEKEILVEKIGKFEFEANRKAKKVNDNNDLLSKAVNERDGHIRKLSNASEKLAETIRCHEQDNRKLSETNEKLQANIKATQMATRKLSTANEKLTKSVKDQQERQEEIQKENEKLSRQLVEHKSEARKSLEEVARLKSKVKQCGCTQNNLSEKLRESQVHEEKAMEEVRLLEQKIETIHNNQNFIRKASDDELQHLMAEHNKLQIKYDELLSKLKSFEENDTKKCDAVELELKRFTQVMCEKEDILLEEKNELKRLIDQLQDIVEQHKHTIGELTSINRQQEVLIHSQSAAIASKNEQLRLAENETVAVRKQSEQLENQVQLFRHSMDKSECPTKIPIKKCICSFKSLNALEHQMQEIRDALDAERDNVLLKQKVIEDQANTIKQLKNAIGAKGDEVQHAHCDARRAADEVRRTGDEIRRLTIDLERERQEKEVLFNDLTNMQWRKEQLKAQVDELEDILQSYCNCSDPGDVQRQQKLICSLEKKIVLQQRESELQRQVMCKEKNQAVQAARFATCKLLETVQDFQKQMDSQNQVQRVLTTMLQDREEQLQYATGEMNDMPSEPSMTATHIASLEDNMTVPEVHEKFNTARHYARESSIYSYYPNVCDCEVILEEDETDATDETASSVSENLHTLSEAVYKRGEADENESTCTDIMDQVCTSDTGEDCTCGEYPCRCDYQPDNCRCGRIPCICSHYCSS